jgi:hypothetical protein
MKLPTIWLTRPLDPSVTIRPISTLTPLKASVWLPGTYGYTTTAVTTQAKATSKRRVAFAVSGWSQLGHAIRPRSTAWNHKRMSLMTKRATTRITAMVNRFGIAPATPSVRSLAVVRRKPLIASPHGRVNGNCRSTKVSVV